MESLTGQLRELQRLYTETCNKLTTATNEIEIIPKLRQDNLSLKMQNKNLEEKIQVLYVSEYSILFHIFWVNPRYRVTHCCGLGHKRAESGKNSTRQLPSSKYEFNHNNVQITCMPKTILNIDTDQIYIRSSDVML